MKVPLTTITWPQVQQVIDEVQLVLEVVVSSVARDGGPACATVPIRDGWVVTRDAPSHA